ncbi:MAG: CBS domain-containing protein [Caldilineaceae bacterium]|nr:CBS domain-containing protein [Caldilineaceae bacterium]
MPQEIDIILTHEHTDFDALASLLGAALLYDDAYPVLPQQLNRNVREFYTLYKNQLPFIEARYLPDARVRRAILVDTDGANWTKGMDHGTERFIINHHDADRGLPDGAAGWTASVGANTTMLLEKLMAQNQRLSPVQATLLALGIHEDTGSLTYSSTTDRDARCLTWLLEQGVNLEVVARYLHHPLTDEQRSLLEKLIDGSEFFEIGGHTIVIAQADAPGFRQGISALASRLRDFHETDGLFLIIDLGEAIQVVARSATDEIDVAKYMRDLGGGGHTRAAAASIKGPMAGSEAVRNRLVTLLQEGTSHALRVRDIMSAGRPQILSAEMTMAEAYALMQRWGHEGFPVVRTLDDGRERLVGVLTRREADRAMNHNLGAAEIRRFMRAGYVVVRPDDTIATLRRMMVETNWGQIPVINGSDQIIGIVTRTDLIKLWDDAPRPEQTVNVITARLESSLPALQHALLAFIGREADRLGYTVYVVGGFVRDLLLSGRSGRVLAFDMDIVIEGDAIDFAHKMEQIYGGRVVPHKRFRTAKWLLDDSAAPVDADALFADLGVRREDGDGLPDHFDFVTARAEFYTEPTALPTVESGSIKLDLHRRDFTINTLAICLNPGHWGELLDTYGGLNDLENGAVRVLHSLSFVDDPTRILRAVRYEQRFDFIIEPRTLELLGDALDLLDKVTPARIRHELERIFQEAEPEKALIRLDELGVLRQIQADLRADMWLAEQYVRLRDALAQPEPDPGLLEPIERLYFGILTYRQPSEADASAIQRLGLRGETQQLVKGLERLRTFLPELRTPGLRPSTAARILDRTSPTVRALVRLVEADTQVSAVLARWDNEWKFISPALDGHDLAALGIPRGPVYARILSALRAARLDGEINSRAEEVEMARRISIDDGA